MKAALLRMFLTGIALGQQTPDIRVQVLTVCEVLGDVDHYAGNAIAIVGRMESSVGLIDHYEFLSQDPCERPVITHGHIWPNKIQIWTFSEEGMPKPPTDKPTLDRAVVAAKLAAVRKTTKLGTHREPGLDARGHPSTHLVPNDWVVVYGRIVRSPVLEKDCGRSGCGGFDVPLIVMTGADQVHRIRGDGTPLPSEKIVGPAGHRKTALGTSESPVGPEGGSHPNSALHSHVGPKDV